MAGVQARQIFRSALVYTKVSIPQSGWRGFKRRRHDGARTRTRSFNPSVGMAGVQARSSLILATTAWMFQSLSRDGGGSSARTVQPSSNRMVFQSLSRDGGGSSPTPSRPGSTGHSFNPSVGMAGVQAPLPLQDRIIPLKFQSLSRDGGGSSRIRGGGASRCTLFQSLSRDGGGSSTITNITISQGLAVSIPQSGWRGFKRGSASNSGPNRSSFNPSVGMAGVQAYRQSCQPSSPGCFNPSVGMAGVQARALHAIHNWAIRFNPSVGMAGVQASFRPLPPLLTRRVSIPQSGWRGFKRG